jgi:hypothetical protein
MSQAFGLIALLWIAWNWGVGKFKAWQKARKGGR